MERLVELAPRADPALVPQALVRVLVAREQPGQPLIDTVVDFLRPRDLLLVLDNCEHLIEASAETVQTLLGTCPDLQILTTSREALRVVGKAVYRVPSLSTPDPGDLPPLEQLARCEAVRLFADRARWRDPGFELTARNAAAVADKRHGGPTAAQAKGG